jgi:hypothetical protein
LSPDLSIHLQAFIRAGYGVLLLLTLLWAIPHWRRYFLSERWGGWSESKPTVDVVQNPAVMPVVLLVWVAAAAALIVGRWTVASALVNLIFCRYFFVAMRWNGVLRGMGAPGFMTYWLGAAVFFLEYTLSYAPALRSLALLTFQVDLAFIMASAGVYKWTAGYASNNGMELGLVNPEWGYWWRFYRRLTPRHGIFNAMNHAAWLTEVVAAVLMVLPRPQLRAAGGLLMIGSFLFICTQIRLAWLTEMVMLCGLLFVPPAHFLDRWIGAVMPATSAVAQTPSIPWLNEAVEAFLIGYLVLLPLVHAGLFYNFYARRRLPGLAQRVLERYTNFFGIIIWRVFSVDHLNFFVRIYEERAGVQRLISRYGSTRALRYSHVAESIAVTTVFTTLKYYASNPTLFESRLLRYARTVPVAPDARLVFEYVSISKDGGRFRDVPVVTYTVSPENWSIQVRPLVESFSVHAADRTSPVHEGRVPGSYAPARR